MALLKEEIPDDSHFPTDLEAPDVFLSGGERIRTGVFDFEVLWTPGHSPGHVCLYEQSRKLFISGDHMLEVITPEIGTAPMQHPNPLADYLRCLEDLKELEVELILPAHGSTFSHFRGRTDELIEHHHNRKDQILATLKKGPLTAFDIASRIAWIPQKGGVPWEKLDVMNRRLALLETWAHLRLLEDERKTTMFTEGDLVFYCTNSHLS
ncbi:MBL fold metallo-hydrolase [Chloroflexota bacterium]